MRRRRKFEGIVLLRMEYSYESGMSGGGNSLRLAFWGCGDWGIPTKIVKSSGGNKGGMHGIIGRKV